MSEVSEKRKTSVDIAKMSVKEFRELGYLQELNRVFLHPLGLAIEVYIDKEGNESFREIWDYRDDPEGLHFNLNKEEPGSERLKRFRRKEAYVADQLEIRNKNRIDKLGFIIEPIPTDTVEEEKDENTD